MKNLDNIALTHLERIDMLVDMYAQRMFIEYNIREITTPKQKSNGTRMFELPSGEQIASYKSGYVRKVSNGRVYQLNKKYLQNQRYTILTGGRLKTINTVRWARELIHDPIGRLLYIVEFAKRNYDLLKIV